MKPLLLLLFSTAIALQPVIAEQKIISVGFIADLSNQYALLSHLMLSGSELAVEQCNKELPSEQYSLKLIAEDDGLIDAKRTINAIRKFVAVDKVSAILAWAYSGGKPIKSALGKQQTPVIFFWDSNPGIAGLGNNYYGTGPNAQKNAELLVEHFTKAGLKKLGVIMLIDEWAEHMHELLQSSLKKKDLALVMEEAVQPNNAHYNTNILKAKRSNAEGVVLLAWGAALITMVKEIGELWPGVRLYVVGQPESDMKMLGKAGNGIFVINGWMTGELATKLAAKASLDPVIKAKTLTPVDLAYAAYGYQSADIICKAVKNLIKDKKEISDLTLNEQLHLIEYNIGLGKVAPGRYSDMQEHMLVWENGAFRK